MNTQFQPVPTYFYSHDTPHHPKMSYSGPGLTKTNDSDISSYKRLEAKILAEERGRDPNFSTCEFPSTSLSHFMIQEPMLTRSNRSQLRSPPNKTFPPLFKFHSTPRNTKTPRRQRRRRHPEFPHDQRRWQQRRRRQQRQ